MRKIITLLVLAALAGLVWYGARWYSHRDDLSATLIFRSAEGLRRGNHLVHDGVVIGTVASVARLESQDAVSIRVDPESRKHVLTDSRFAIEGSRPNKRLTIDNASAVGRPLEDGDIIYARQESLTGWMQRQASRISPALRDLGAKADKWIRENTDFHEELENWEAKYPEWKKQGDEVVRRNLDRLRVETAKLEEELRKAGRKVEADRLRDDFEAWLKKIREDEPAAPATTTTGEP